jgi:hypothetical protein
MVTDLPNHLQGERPLAEYFENMGLSVESVTVCREVESLKKLLDLRTKALLDLEAAWVKYVGNPSSVESYDPSENALPLLAGIDSTSLEEQPNRLVVPHHQRPTLRTGWFKQKVDALEYLEIRFKEADELVKRRRAGKFKASHAAFVTFEKMSSAVCNPLHQAKLSIHIPLYSKLQFRPFMPQTHHNVQHTLHLNLATLSGLACLTRALQFEYVI